MATIENVTTNILLDTQFMTKQAKEEKRNF